MNEVASAPRAQRKTAALGAGGAALLGLASVGAIATREPWSVGRELLLSRGTGWLALGALLLSLCCTPLARIALRLGFRQARVLPIVRRALGITSAWLALLHAWTALSTTLQWNWVAIAQWPHLRAGLTALATLVLLLATSFGTVIARLRVAFFKELHRLGYVAALFVLLHLLLAPFAARALTLWLFGSVFLLGLARFLRPAEPPSV